MSAILCAEEILKLCPPVAQNCGNEQAQPLVFGFSTLQSPGLCSPACSCVGSTREALPACRPAQLPSTGTGMLQRQCEGSRSVCQVGGGRQKRCVPLCWFQLGFQSAGAVPVLCPLSSHCILQGESSLGGCCRLSSSRGS